MNLDALLAQLEGVRRRGTRWSALCPVPEHGDTSPSLSISEGERGILVKCWAGCSLQEICGSLGIEQRDLFLDARKPRPRGRRPISRPVKIDRVALAFRFELAGLDHRLRASRIIEAGKHLNVADLNDDELDRALHAVARAHNDEARAHLFEQLADTLRERDYSERTHCEQPTRVA